MLQWITKLVDWLLALNSLDHNIDQKPLLTDKLMKLMCFDLWLSELENLHYHGCGQPNVIQLEAPHQHVGNRWTLCTDNKTGE